MMHINTINGHQRMSTQELLRIISEGVANGETDFKIKASGQHDIGGPLWNTEGKELRLTVTNPGQRAGSMCMPNTKVIIDGSAPADVGWLNSGGTISVYGDAGDTAGHCAAGGKIYIGGRAGTRSGSLMKHDPEQEPPELWILKSTGSFSFEFMGGGYVVVCGHDSQTLPSVLGERPAVGMVGGVIYFRGPAPVLPPDVIQMPLTDEDIAWLDAGLDEFLQNISSQKLKSELSIWRHWHKLVPDSEHKRKDLVSMEHFRKHSWIKNGIFAENYQDDFQVLPLVAKGSHRLHIPAWQNNACKDCRLCLLSCPQNAIKRRKDENIIYTVNDDKCIGCGVCTAVCPQTCWTMRPNLL